MLNLADITASLASTLVADADMIAAGMKIERADYVNMDPNRCPWLGLYRTAVRYTPRTLGNGPDSWEGVVTIRMLIQATHLQSGAACEARLEGYIQDALEAVWADPTWVNVVDMVTELSVEYSYREDDQSTIYYQWAMVTITAEASTG